MPVTSACGRFENAPAHVIIISPCYRSSASGSIEHIQRNDKPKAESEAAMLERLNKSKVKDDLRKAREAMYRLQKMAIMRKKEAEAKRKKVKDWRPGESSDQRKLRWAREYRRAILDEKLKFLPDGYVKITEMNLRVCYDVAREACSKHKIQCMKIGKTWYAPPVETVAYFEANHARHMASLRKNIQRIRKRK